MKPSRFELGLAGVLTVLLGGSLLGNPGLTGREPGWCLVLAGLLSIAVGMGWEQFRQKLHRRVYWVAPCLLLWATLAGATSISPYLTQRSLASLTCGLSVLLATALAGRSRWLWRRLCSAAVALATLSAGVAWSLVVTQSSWDSRLSANFTNPDSYAVVLFVGFCLAVSTLQHKRAFLNYLQAGTAGFLLLTLLATQSRSAVAALLTAGLLWSIGLQKAPGRRNKHQFAYLLVALLPILAFSVSSGKAAAVSQRIQNLAASPFDLPLRAEFVEGSLRCAVERPLWGSGPGTFALAYQEFRPLETPTQEYINVAHNDSLQFLVETGFPGLFLWLALLFLLLRGGLGSQKDPATLGLTACVAGLFVFSLFNFILPLTTTAIWFFFVAGLVLARSQPGADDLELSRWNLPASALMVLAGLATVFVGVRLWIAQEASESAFQHRHELKWKEAAAALDTAISFEPGNPEHRLHRAQTFQEMATLYGRTEWLQQVEHDLNQALSLSPRDPVALSRSFRYHLKHGHLERALETAEAAYRFAPYSHRFRRRLAGVQVLKGELQTASQTLKLDVKAASKALASILYRLERENSGEGTEFLHSLSAEEQALVLREACRVAAKQNDLQGLQKFQSLERVDNEERAVTLALAQAQELHSLEAQAELQAHLEQWCLPGHENQDAYPELLLLLAQSGNPEAASKLQDYLSRHPERAVVRLAASFLVSPADAITLINEGLELTPRNVDFLLRLADLYAQDGLPEIAKDYYQRALAQGAKPETVNSKIRQLENIR